MRRPAAGLIVVGLFVVLSATPVASVPGELDPTFGGDGRVTTPVVAVGSIANAVAIQPDGKIVAAGETLHLYDRFALARYDPDGTLDPSFGDAGTVTTRFRRWGGVANAIAVQADGKIVAAGGSFGIFPKFALARYLPDGTLDASFGGDGRVRTFFTVDGAMGSAVAIQADGKILVAGAAEAVGANGMSGFALARYNPDGSLDATFGADGTVTTDFPGGHASAIAIQANGKIVAAGEAGNRPALARYNPDGSLDATFDGDGMVTTEVVCCPVFVGANAVAIQPDGRIVTAGEHFECFGGGGFSCESFFILARYEADGALDSTFGTGGLTFGVFGIANALALQADGKIVAAGTLGSGKKFALARYNADGTLDMSFGGDGRRFIDFTNNADFGQGVAIDADGRIVMVGGAAVFGPHPRFALARFQAT